MKYFKRKEKSNKRIAKRKEQYMQMIIIWLLKKLYSHNIKLFRIIDHLLPKDEKLYLFGTYRGQFFRDNAYFFFLYLNKNHKDIKTVIFTTNSMVRNDINKTYGQLLALNPYTLKGLRAMLRGKVLIISYNLFSDLPLSVLFSRKKTVVNVWHGIPIKGINISDSEWSNKQIDFYMSREAKRYDLFPSSSKFTKLIYAGTFGVPYYKIPITGSPRDDHLFNAIINEKKKKKIFSLLAVPNAENKTIILYAPTKREQGSPKFFPFKDANIGELNKFLIEKNVILLLRPHSGNSIISDYGVSELGLFEKYEAFYILNDELVPNVNDILSDIDILVTDYSGIFYDFLLIGKPIIFIPYDIEEYSLRTGFLLDYNNITPGPKIHSQKEFVHIINQYITDPYKDNEKRLFIKNLFHKYFDGKACERIYDEIQYLIK
jgi:CDP-glycerol glycerophosphotransferase (TagB/SpsB family)